MTAAALNTRSGGPASGGRPGYDRLTYRSHFTPDLVGPDDAHAVRDGDAVPVELRTGRLVAPLARRAEPGASAITRVATWTSPGGSLATTVRFRGDVEVREHQRLGSGVLVHDGGPAVPAPVHDALTVDRSPGVLVVAGPGSFCAIAAPGAELHAIRREGVNALGDVSATPFAVHTEAACRTAVLAAPGPPRGLNRLHDALETAT